MQAVALNWYGLFCGLDDPLLFVDCQYIDKQPSINQQNMLFQYQLLEVPVLVISGRHIQQATSYINGTPDPYVSDPT